MKVAAIQMRCSGDPFDDRAVAATLITAAAADGAELVVLPELFASLDRTSVMRERAEPLHGPTVAWASRLAAENRIAIVAGSFVEVEGSRLFNTSCLVDATGALRAVYRKVHLFDVTVEGAASRESDTFSAGDEVVTSRYADDSVGVGLSICYDLRFAGLFHTLGSAGASVIAVPAAFTESTGRDHWELLVRTRAVENQVAVVAAAQWGTSPDGIERHGHALVVDAWGRILGEADGEGDAVVVADIDLTAQDEIRRRLPVLEHRRPDLYG
jgi:deaminated glutathione amidase